jgi:2-C-methyl-D-erythritol 4-phosphate cytidylyltransferase
LTQATAVIAAAGSGERLGAGGPKALVEAYGRPLLAWVLLAFDAAPSIGEIVVAAPPGAEAQIAGLAEQAGVEVEVVAGSEHRSGSVANALAEVETDLVVIHDAARPLVTAALIDAVAGRLAADADVTGVIAATPVTDTIKEASASRRVLRTPERSRMWSVQTPQAFRTGGLRTAVAAHPDELGTVTDDAMLVERQGGEVLIHQASPENIKVTTPLDLQIAGMLLAERA